MRLADEAVRNAQCQAGRKDALLFDDALPGFGLRVTASGTRIFIFRYRFGTAVRRTKIGRWGEISAAQARKRAEALRGEVREARDPVAERRAAVATAAVAEAQAKAQAAADAYTVDVLIETWAAQHLVGRSASYRRRPPADLRRGLADSLMAPALAFTQADAVKALDAEGRFRADRSHQAARRGPILLGLGG